MLTDPQQVIGILGLTAIRHGHGTPPAHYSIRHVTANGTREEQVCRRQFDLACVGTGYGVDQLSDRNVGAVLDMTMPANTWHSA